jgi:flagellar hook-basal body complex protein FliE
MAIPAISGALPSLPTPATATVKETAAAERAGFGNALVGALDRLQETHAQADRMAVQAATGDLTDVHDYVIAATEASLATELTVAVRNRAVEAFNQIMQMQL